ncbi:MAG: hypothetical protein WDA60_13335 [Acidimicrobiia bacterium]|jgi:hypothetical protein
MTAPKLDPDRMPWLEIAGSPDGSYPIHHDLAILGWDRDAGTLDLMIRFDDRGGHCHAHRHVSTTSVLVLEGEQHLDELLPDGTRVHKVRRAGEHHLTPGDANPHMERGGPDGAVLFFSHHTTDGRLYEIVDDDRNPVAVVTIDSLVAMWEGR